MGGFDLSWTVKKTAKSLVPQWFQKIVKIMLIKIINLFLNLFFNHYYYPEKVALCAALFLGGFLPPNLRAYGAKPPTPMRRAAACCHTARSALVGRDDMAATRPGKESSRRVGERALQRYNTASQCRYSSAGRATDL